MASVEKVQHKRCTCESCEQDFRIDDGESVPAAGLVLALIALIMVGGFVLFG